MTNHAQIITALVEAYDVPGLPEATLTAAANAGHSPSALLLDLTAALGRSLAASGVTLAEVPTLRLEAAHV